MASTVSFWLRPRALEGFFPGGGQEGIFPNFFPGGPKVVKFVFYPSKLKKQPWGAKAPLYLLQTPMAAPLLPGKIIASFFH